MVSARSSRARVVGRRKLRLWLGALAAPLALISACGKLVGIGDTEVATGGAGQSSSGGGGASTSSGGAKATGGGSATSGGSPSSGGSTATGGASSGAGGKAAQGGSVTSGGSAGAPEGGDSAAGDGGVGPGSTGGTSLGGASGAGGKAGTGGASGAGGKAGTGGASGAGGKAGTGGASGGAGGKASTGGASGGAGGKASTGGAGGASGGAGGKASTGGAAGGGAGGSAGCTPACPLDKPACEAGQCVLRGPTMVKVSTFYVDSTEVTVAQYQAFLTAKGTNTSGQPAVCSWNTSYYDATIPMNPDNFPMSNVDWCDANAFCGWAGKHLCGKIGGGAIAYADLFTANLHQWYLACGGPNNGTHPNSNPMCNSGTGVVAAVGTYPGCIGFYPGLYDLEGNVAEWVDGCAGNTGKDDICYLMGGGIFDNTRSYCTEVYDEYPRNDSAGSFGFRCCSG